MILKGTELYHQKELFGFHEQLIGDFNIPVVTPNTSFSETDWLQMKALASDLSPNKRI